jgi:hypothetical protein
MERFLRFNEGNALEMNRTREIEGGGEMLADRKPLVT